MSDAEIQALVARLHRLEAEAEHLSAENARLRAQLAEAEVRIADPWIMKNAMMARPAVTLTFPVDEAP